MAEGDASFGRQRAARLRLLARVTGQRQDKNSGGILSALSLPTREIGVQVVDDRIIRGAAQPFQLRFGKAVPASEGRFNLLLQFHRPMHVFRIVHPNRNSAGVRDNVCGEAFVVGFNHHIHRAGGGKMRHVDRRSIFQRVAGLGVVGADKGVV